MLRRRQIPADPVLGNVHELASDALGFYERRSAEYGGIVRYDVFGTESYLVTDPGRSGGSSSKTTIGS